MDPEQARYTLNLLLPAYEFEVPLTRRLIASVPADRADYRPEPRVRSAFEQAWHIVSNELWFLDGILHGHFGAEEPRLPAHIRCVADVLAYYDGNVPGLLQELRSADPAELARPTDFQGTDREAAVCYLLHLITHTVHHRAQLALYLRMMGVKVPAIYEGSLDEPFPMLMHG